MGSIAGGGGVGNFGFGWHRALGIRLRDAERQGAPAAAAGSGCLLLFRLRGAVFPAAAVLVRAAAGPGSLPDGFADLSVGRAG